MHQRHLSLLVNKYRLQCCTLVSYKRFTIHQEPNISKRNPESLRKTNACRHKHYNIHYFAVIYSFLCNFEFQNMKHYKLHQPYHYIFPLEKNSQEGSFKRGFIFALKAHHTKGIPIENLRQLQHCHFLMLCSGSVFSLCSLTKLSIFVLYKVQCTRRIPKTNMTFTTV